jgi:hypothetical protein
LIQQKQFKMLNKNLFLIPAATLLLVSCGGDENGEESTSSSETTENSNSQYHTSFGECTASSSSIMLAGTDVDESYAYVTDEFAGLDAQSFSTASAELTEKHNTLYIKFVNNPDIVDATIGSYGADDASLTITVKSESGEIEAGEFSGDDLKLKLTKGMKIDGTSKTKELGSNKTPKTIVINDISEDHLCGSFNMTTEEGTELFSASFDLDVKVVKF